MDGNPWIHTGLAYDQFYGPSPPETNESRFRSSTYASFYST